MVRFSLVLKRMKGYIRQLSLISEKQLILNYQMGKVGSSSVGEWLRLNNKPEWHIHRFFDTPVHGYKNKNLGLKTADLLLFKVFRLLNRKILIVTGVREPLDRDASMYFHNNGKKNLDVKAHVECFNSFFPILKCVDWYRDELLALVGVDIFDYKFDKIAGFSIIEKNNVRIFLYRLDKLAELEKELSLFFGYEDFELISRNIGENKSYSFEYAKFKSAISFDRRSITKSERRFMSHFYSESDIEAYFGRWYN